MLGARSVRMSALALLKMAMHARSGGDLEVRYILLTHAQLYLRNLLLIDDNEGLSLR